ncbi:putative fatty acyl-CoA reductase CG5065 [Trichoplusia ni]|uniref:Fatty acyl-CoA reductase n=1 Tax=Trichoplusia ni TaxID=7111 RepID=A0A7E5VXS4_TRINI|nr:putative fatty acyl-CoA reductase CG5065 [Trichoplusia ni]
MIAVTSHENEASIVDFYEGKSVFITGGTGFLGKVFIEKLLYCCPGLVKIYMLIREKKGLTIKERIDRFVDDSLFDRLKTQRPKDLDKIVLIPGDITAPSLGISQEQENILIEEVSVIIHSAATIKFNAPLEEAWSINVDGTRRILDLCRNMKKVEVFLHISTAYTNINRNVIEEVLYPPPADIKELEKLDKHNVTEKQTMKLLNGFPNTYTFTKSLTEHLVAENCAYMPTIIVRPSVVAAVLEDPIKGWLENWYGATGISVFTAKGLNRVFLGHKNIIVDVIPADYVANLVIIAGARNNKSKELKIYNCCSSGCNPLTIGNLLGAFIDDAIRHKTYAMPLPGWFIFTRYRLVATIVTFIFQVVPAYLADLYRRIIGKKPKYTKLLYLVVQTRVALDFFSSNSWVMKADRMRELYASLSNNDKRMFPCDPTHINWPEYLSDYGAGVRRFLEKRN